MTLTPMSAAPALTPLRTTPQKPSIAWPWVTTSILMSLFGTSAPSSAAPAAATARRRRRVTCSEHDHRAHEQDRLVFRRFILCLSSRIDRAPARPTSVADRPRRLVARFPWTPPVEHGIPIPSRDRATSFQQDRRVPPVSLGSPRVAPVGAHGASGSPPLRCAARRHHRGPCTGSGPPRARPG